MILKWFRKELPETLVLWDEFPNSLDLLEHLFYNNVMNSKWNSASHSKYLLQYHLIFVCKYRKKILSDANIANDIKTLSQNICDRHDVRIKYMETDKDHIHYMIETGANINLADFVRTMKSFTSYHIWDKYKNLLSQNFWKEHTFWTDGYFLCSVGNVSEQTLKQYIENQG